MDSIPQGPKKVGDGKTPEGTYRITEKNSKSQYHKALRLSYPNAEDQQRAKALNASPGGDVMIHGLHNSLGWVGKLHTLKDWTKGCIAVTNSQIDELFQLIPIGCMVKIVA